MSLQESAKNSGLIKKTVNENMSSKKKTSKALKRDIPFIVLVAPFTVFFVIFTVIPIISALALSLTDYNLLQINHFVGLKNYTRLLLDDSEENCQAARSIGWQAHCVRQDEEWLTLF